MAKKKSRKQVVKAPLPKVATVFDCPFCGHKKCVFVKLIRNKRKGIIQCKICRKQPWDTNIKGLDEEIDVYFYWIEAIKKANKNTEEEPKEEVNEIDKTKFDV